MASQRRNRQKEKFRDIGHDEQGNAIYTGDLHRIAGDMASSRTCRIRLIICALVLAAVVISSGCIDSAGAMGSFYVILPYIGEVSALFALLWSSAKLLWTGQIRTFALKNSGEKIQGECRILTFFAILGLAFSAVYISRNGMGEDMFKNILYLVLKLAAALISEYYRKSFTSVEWETVSENEH